jgi:hypothetical protein
MPHDENCSGCPLCRPAAFADVMKHAKRDNYAPPDPYAEGLSKMERPLTPSLDLIPGYDPESRAPVDSYAVAIAIRRVEEEMKKERK